MKKIILFYYLLACFSCVASDGVALCDPVRLRAEAEALKARYAQTASAPPLLRIDESSYPRVATKHEMIAQHCFLLMNCARCIGKACALSGLQDVVTENEERSAADIIAECRQLMHILSIDDIILDWLEIEAALNGTATHRYCFPFHEFRVRINAIISGLAAIDAELDLICEPTRTYRLIEQSDIDPDSGLNLDGGVNWPTGVYKLASDIIFSGTTVIAPATEAAAINISADHMVLDLAGHTIRGTNQNANGIQIGSVVAADHVTVKNGNVSSFGYNGISSAGSYYSHIQDVTVMLSGDEGISLSGYIGGLIENIVVTYSGNTGLRYSSNHQASVIRDSVAMRNGWLGANRNMNGFLFDSYLNTGANAISCSIGVRNIASRNNQGGHRFASGNNTGDVLDYDNLFKDCVAIANGSSFHDGRGVGFWWGGKPSTTTEYAMKQPVVACYSAGNGYPGSTEIRNVDYFGETKTSWPNPPLTSLPYYMSNTAGSPPSIPTTAQYWDNVGYTWAHSI